MVDAKQSIPKHIRDPFSVKWPKKGGEKLVGCYVPRTVAEHLNLLALEKGVTLSTIFRGAIQEILNDATAEDTLIASYPREPIMNGKHG